MESLRISFFGRFSIQKGGQSIAGCQSCKAQELLSYLLLHRDRPHARETLASLLWGDHCTTAQSKKYLRKALWQLQATLNDVLDSAGDTLVLVDSDWLQINTKMPLWFDVGVFEAAYAQVRGIPGDQLEPESVRVVQHGVEIYGGDLLEGWYQDWCLGERERLQQIYLIMLDKLIGYCETTRQYELGLFYGECNLRYDRAREHTYQQVMRLLYAIGDRTGALRQYDRCVAALKEELDVKPSARTTTLYELIRTDQATALDAWAAPAEVAPLETSFSLLDRLDRIINLQHKLAALQTKIQHEIKAVEGALRQEVA